MKSGLPLIYRPILSQSTVFPLSERHGQTNHCQQTPRSRPASKAFSTRHAYRSESIRSPCGSTTSSTQEQNFITKSPSTFKQHDDWTAYAFAKPQRSASSDLNTVTVTPKSYLQKPQANLSHPTEFKSAGTKASAKEENFRQKKHQHAVLSQFTHFQRTTVQHIG